MLKLVLDQYSIPQNDFGRAINFKIYDEADAAFSATGYTGEVKVSNEKGSQVVDDISPTWTVQGSGTGSFKFTSTLRPDVSGYYWVEIELTKSGEQISTERARIYVAPSPADT